MGDDREALFNMLHDAISQPAWDECTIDMERAAYLTEWLSDAGWRPPPEPQDSGLPPLEPLQQQPARFKLRVTETPPPLPIAEPQAAASEAVERARDHRRTASRRPDGTVFQSLADEADRLAAALATLRGLLLIEETR